MEDLMYCNNDGNFYFASQPMEHTYPQLKELGVEYVINLRSDAEGDFGPHRSACESIGITYIQHSFMGPTGIDENSVNEINKIVSANKDSKFMVHCASANRTGGWYAIYLNKECGIEVDQAIEKAMSTNNMNGPMAEMVRDFLD
jgi:protein tyrosine phosphatase (PTP) superfamily phosphohydrolase (DUF442 family)